ncbi:hypothetical protein D3C83_32980 [compost metagenome]
MNASMAGVSVSTPASVTNAGTRAFGLIARYSGLRWSLARKSSRTAEYSAPASSSAMCDASEQVFTA